MHTYFGDKLAFEFSEEVGKYLADKGILAGKVHNGWDGENPTATYIIDNNGASHDKLKLEFTCKGVIPYYNDERGSSLFLSSSDIYSYIEAMIDMSNFRGGGRVSEGVTVENAQRASDFVLIANLTDEIDKIKGGWDDYASNITNKGASGGEGSYEVYKISNGSDSKWVVGYNDDYFIRYTGISDKPIEFIPKRGEDGYEIVDGVRDEDLFNKVSGLKYSLYGLGGDYDKDVATSILNSNPKLQSENPRLYNTILRFTENKNNRKTMKSMTVKDAKKALAEGIKRAKNKKNKPKFKNMKKKLSENIGTKTRVTEHTLTKTINKIVEKALLESEYREFRFVDDIGKKYGLNESQCTQLKKVVSSEYTPRAARNVKRTLKEYYSSRGTSGNNYEGLKMETSELVEKVKRTYNMYKEWKGNTKYAVNRTSDKLNVPSEMINEMLDVLRESLKMKNEGSSYNVDEKLQEVCNNHKSKNESSYTEAYDEIAEYMDYDSFDNAEYSGGDDLLKEIDPADELEFDNRESRYDLDDDMGDGDEDYGDYEDIIDSNEEFDSFIRDLLGN